MSTWPFGELAMFRYGVILADPPWRFENYSAKGEAKNPSAHYVCQDLGWIKSLPVGHLGATDCALILWATAPLLDAAVDVLRCWGFRFVSAGAWAKESRTGQSIAFGTGYTYRNAAEFWLLGFNGRPKIRSHKERNLIWAPVREHSRKPDEMHRGIEAMFHGPYCELFARETRPGWDAWGNQVGKFGGEAA